MSASLPKGAVRFEFRGRAGEWFGIWIVNLLLSIVTIGIYSAWAKVRAKKYFYNSTYCSGRNFDYHATGGQILVGRLIVIGVFIVFQVVASLFPPAGLALALILIALSPWLLVRAMAFNARNSSFSNVRFDFVGSVGKAALVYLLYPILMTLSLYTTFPLLDRAMKGYAIRNHRLGGAGFTFDVGVGPFYRAFLIAVLWVAAVGFVGAALTGFSLSAFGEAMRGSDQAPQAALLAVGLLYLFIFAAILPAALLYQALVRNAVYNAISLEGGHRFVSNVKAHELLWIVLSNMVVVVCTLFLMLPWAQVRMARYLADHTGVVPGGSLDEFVTRQRAAGGAIGDAYADFEGVGAGLPI